MKIISVSLKEEYGAFGGKLDCLSLDNTCPHTENDWKRPCVIVVPGGGYASVSAREGEGVAAQFLARGYQVAVLTYSVVGQGAKYPDQLIELGCAVDYVKKHAKELYINPDEVFVVGFSAGGHLTANLAVDYASISGYLGRELNAKPTAVGLCYPVITNEEAHIGSHNNLLNGYSEEEKAELLKRVNLDKMVTENTAPAYIWTTATDNVVPAANSLRFATALAKNGVAYELHVYPSGVHGLSTGDDEVSYSLFSGEKRFTAWMHDCAGFFRSFCTEKF